MRISVLGILHWDDDYNGVNETQHPQDGPLPGINGVK